MARWTNAAEHRRISHRFTAPAQVTRPPIFLDGIAATRLLCLDSYCLVLVVDVRGIPQSNWSIESRRRATATGMPAWAVPRANYRSHDCVQPLQLKIYPFKSGGYGGFFLAVSLGTGHLDLL